MEKSEVNMSQVQSAEPYERVKSAILSGRNIFITGSAGTGKSFILNKLKEEFQNLSITATTGASAVNVGGITIHSFAGLGIGDRTAGQLIYRMHPETAERLRACSLLAIDEISMLDAKMFDLLNEVLKIVRGKDEAFGGLQVILFGDFLQLPPVDKDKNAKFAFESEAWTEANFVNVLLTKVYRQTDQVFLEILKDARFGTIGPGQAPHLTANVAKDRDMIHLFARNKPADDFNFQRLREVPGANKYYAGEDWGTDRGLDLLQKNCLTPKELFLKVGARVMLLINLDQTLGLINGSLGTVSMCSDGMVEVNFDNGETISLCKQRVSEIRVNDTLIAYREQIPLRLAWAISIHKSQGMTLERVKIDFDGVFEYGQAYVALSRAKSLEGLYVENFNVGFFKAHPTAIGFMNRLTKEVSNG